jgi:hypothetical protein
MIGAIARRLNPRHSRMDAGIRATDGSPANTQASILALPGWKNAIPGRWIPASLPE